MSAKQDSYRQMLPPLGLSTEKGTPGIPADGKYYVRQNDKELGSFRLLKQAQELFKRVVAESGYKPEPKTETKKSAAELAHQRYMESKDLYWADSHKYRGGGGKGGRGGV